MPRKAKKQTRRGNKEGSIYQRKDGKWCGQVLAGYNELGKPIRKTYYGVTREDVARKVAEATHLAFSGTLSVDAPMPGLTVEKLISEFLWTFKKPTVSDVTFEWYLGVTNTHIIPSLGGLSAKAVTPHHMQMALNKMYDDKRLSVRTIKGVRDMLNQTYKHAIEMKLAEINPISGTKLPKQSRVKPDDAENAKVIPVADRTKILEAAKDDIRMKTAITVLMFTGMRVGEFLALTWKSVDFQNSIITINQAITRSCEYNEDGSVKSRKTVVGDTKTQCSKRKMKVSPAVMDAMREWQEALPDHMRTKPKHDILADNAVVFPNDMGKMRTYDGFRTTYRRFMSENNLGDYTIHSYRHTFATMLLERGVNPKVVQKLLGHRDIETTLSTYSHVLPEVFDGVADTISSIHADMLDGNCKTQKPAESPVL